MASEVIPHHRDIRVGGYFNPSHGNLSLKERNVQSQFFNRKAHYQASSRPAFLRLNSAGEAGDSSPELEEDLSGVYTDRHSPEKTDFIQGRQQRFNVTSCTQGFCSKTVKKTSKRPIQYLQSNYSSSASKGTDFLEHLASNTKSIACTKKAAVSSTPPEMSDYCPRQEMGHHIRMSNHIGPGMRGNISLHQPPNPNMGGYPFVNIPFMNPGPSVFHPQSAPGWNQPLLNPYVPRAAPPLHVQPQLNHPPWIHAGYPFQGPHLPLNQTRFSFCPQGTQFAMFSSQPQKPNNSFAGKSNYSSRSKFNNRHSSRDKKHSNMFTKILQRPTQSHKEEKSKDGHQTKNSELIVPQNNVEMAVADKKETHAKDLRKDEIAPSKKHDHVNFVRDKSDVSTQCAISAESRNTDQKSKVQNDSKNNKPVADEENNMAPRNRHSTIEFLLSGLNLKSSEGLSDSDFVDCEWDTVDESDDMNSSWDELFVSDDPYNPLTGWRCQKKVSDKNEDAQRSAVSSCSQEFDSGTESGSEDESDSDSDDWEDDSVCNRTADVVTCAKESESAVSPKEKVDEQDDQCGQNPKKEDSEEEPFNQENNIASSPADSAKRRKCLHPSISYILGENGSSSDEFSDDESDDWDSFDDSDDDFAPSLLRREDLNLFQFSNNHFNPLTSFLCNQGIRPELKTSPSVPCGPIFKPKARTMLISQRIICQVSDSPVSMVVPLEQSGKMSQNSIPTVQCSVVPSQHQSFPNSCMKQLFPRTEKGTSKKVHFNNKATLIICPEPSHLVDEIKSTRRGPWLDYARDRCRFQHRIQHLEKTIGPCLSVEHRKKIAERRQLRDSQANSSH